MRKFAGVCLAAAMLLPVGLIAAPSGAAGTGLTCSKIAGTAAWTPPVPAAPKTAVSNVVLKATFSSCAGTAGVTSGKVTVPLIKGTTKQNCTTLVTKPTKITVPKGGTIVWNKGAKSTLAVLTLSPTKTLATYTATVKIASGQFAAKTVTLTSGFKVNGCPLKSATLSLAKNTKIVIK